MSTSRRRSRRRRDHEPAATAGQPVPQELRPGSVRPLTPWNWRTFPVYFAFSFGLFLGVYAGALGVIAGNDGNNTFFLLISVAAAILFGFGLSRVAVRWMMARNWVKPRPARKR